MLNSRFWTNSQTRPNSITAWASPTSCSVKWRGILSLMESQFTTDQVKFLWQSTGTHSYSWMERGAERSIVTHLTWPSPTHSSLPPSLHFVRFPEPISPLERRQTLWEIACFVPEHKPMETTRTRIQFFHWGIQTKLRRLNLSTWTSKHQFSELSFIHFFWFLLWEFGVTQNTSSRWYLAIFLSPLCLRMY